MGGIFLSYRREDATGYVHALRDRLASRFGSEQIFMDIDSIEPGLDFVEVIEGSVSSCSIVLALIGKRFQPERLQDNRDFVRLEILTALDKKIRVIPVLLEGAEMPAAEVLPEALAPLSRRQAFEISNRHFNDDLDALADVVGKILKEQETKKVTLPPLPPTTVPEPVKDKTDQPAGKGSGAPFPAERTIVLPLRPIAKLIPVFLAWLVVGLYAMLTAVVAGSSPNFSRAEDKFAASFLVIGLILLLLGFVLKLRRSPRAWGFFLGAGFWQFISLIGVASLAPSSDFSGLLAFAAVFSVVALAFFFLAHRYRRRP